MVCSKSQPFDSIDPLVILVQTEFSLPPIAVVEQDRRSSSSEGLITNPDYVRPVSKNPSRPLIFDYVDVPSAPYNIHGSDITTMSQCFPVNRFFFFPLHLCIYLFSLIPGEGQRTSSSQCAHRGLTQPRRVFSLRRLFTSLLSSLSQALLLLTSPRRSLKSSPACNHSYFYVSLSLYPRYRSCRTLAIATIAIGHLAFNYRHLVINYCTHC